MTTSTSRRPATPSPAERARTIAKRVGCAELLSCGVEPERSTPLLHHVHADGTATVLLDDDHAFVDLARRSPRREVGAVLEITDSAPVPVREPVRGLLWLTGWVRLLEHEAAARDAVLAVAEERPDSRLLDVGHGASVLRVESASLVLADAEESGAIAPAGFRAAEPDPFCLLENGWLRHLEVAHRDVVGLLTRHLPEELRGGHLRPLGIDRYGIRLRVESPDGDHDVRLAFSRPATTTEHLSHELRRLVGCPFLAAQQSG
ncbi:DUF2470 domain-containing protein [Salinifilum ghardaiensis]